MLLSRSHAKLIWNVLIALLMLAALQAVAQKGRQKSHNSAAQTAQAKKQAGSKRERDPAIAQVIQDVSPQKVKAVDEKLVSFGNRSTLAVNNPDAATSPQGIVAARNWIKSEFERISADCNGCLEVKTDTFVEQPKSRIPKPTEI